MDSRSITAFSIIIHFSSLQWLPQSIFAVYRVLLLAYTIAWLIAHVVVRHNVYSVRWLIFIGNLNYLLYTVSQLFITTGTVVYTILHYVAPTKLLSLFPREKNTRKDFFSQDNLPLLFKITWYLYVTANTMVVVTSLAFWAFINNDDSFAGSPDAVGVHFHVVAMVLVLADLFISRFPYQLLHFFYPCSFTVVYIIFTGVYFAARGTRFDGERYVYSLLDYSKTISILFAILVILVPMVFFLLLFLLAWLRDVVYRQFTFCFRHVSPVPSERDSSHTYSKGENTQLDVIGD